MAVRRATREVLNVSDIPTLFDEYARRSLYRDPSAILHPSSALNRKVSVLRYDITKIAADAIVNAANNRLSGGAGVDGAIQSAAGPQLLAESLTLNGCRTGDAKITKGYMLPANHVIHTVGPVYHQHDKKDADRLLESCYVRSLQVAVENGVNTVAFPSISTGVFGFPVKEATPIVLKSVRQFLLSEDGKTLERVIFVLFGNEDEEIYRGTIPKYFPPSEEADIARQ
ncbi:A1pp-domain-containing protein [Lipomyces orientalis]|uniref:A1pp-domain-containing protein n=1 Tax=Lipomyces orientalis TaxID=1233043 RepID=A0ACC3TZP2_9ASCO